MAESSFQNVITDQLQILRLSLQSDQWISYPGRTVVGVNSIQTWSRGAELFCSVEAARQEQMGVIADIAAFERVFALNESLNRLAEASQGGNVLSLIFGLDQQAEAAASFVHGVYEHAITGRGGVGDGASGDSPLLFSQELGVDYERVVQKSIYGEAGVDFDGEQRYLMIGLGGSIVMLTVVMAWALLTIPIAGGSNGIQECCGAARSYCCVTFRSEDEDEHAGSSISGSGLRITGRRSAGDALLVLCPCCLGLWRRSHGASASHSEAKAIKGGVVVPWRRSKRIANTQERGPER